MASLISTTTPLAASATFTSSVQTVARATQITGSVFTDQNGTLYVEQSGDGTNWDVHTSIGITGGVGEGIEVDVLNQFFRVRLVNGSTPQTTLRLYVDIRDPYGDFLAAAGAPSAGGAYFVLYWDPGAARYDVVGRFDGLDGWNANGNAAIYQDKSGKYASFLVTNAMVSDETITTFTEHAADSF